MSTASSWAVGDVSAGKGHPSPGQGSAGGWADKRSGAAWRDRSRATTRRRQVGGGGLGTTRPSGKSSMLVTGT